MRYLKLTFIKNWKLSWTYLRPKIYRSAEHFKYMFRYIPAFLNIAKPHFIVLESEVSAYYSDFLSSSVARDYCHISAADNDELNHQFTFENAGVCFKHFEVSSFCLQFFGFRKYFSRFIFLNFQAKAKCSKPTQIAFYVVLRYFANLRNISISVDRMRNVRIFHLRSNRWQNSFTFG